MSLRSLRLLALCALAALAAATLAAGDDDAAPSAERSAAPVHARMAVLGASASDGFLIGVTLSDALQVRLADGDAPILHCASSGLFLAPLQRGREQVEAALRIQPTVIVAADFLFWFGYGFVAQEGDRMGRLEYGLELLERFECPVLTSTLPDMSSAVGLMLREGQVPRPRTLEALNERVRSWAAARSNVVLVPMPEAIRDMRSGAEVRLGDLRWSPEEARGLLQGDRLHPTLDGLSVLAELVIRGLGEAPIRLDPQLVRRDYAAGLRVLHELSELRVQERERARQERRERRAERAGRR